MLGTFLRGPNWNFFGPFEYWDTHKLEALTNVNLSEYFWVRDARAGAADELLRPRAAGHLLCLIYVGGLARRCWRSAAFKSVSTTSWARRGSTSTVFLFLMMMSLPIKMLLRWIFNLKYIVAIPEIFFNI